MHRQLKDLRRFPVPSDALEAGRKRLTAVMAEFPMRTSPGLFGMHALLWKPALATLTVAIVVVSGGGVVLASREALPGDRLYTVKLAVEEAHERVAISPQRKFTVQAEHAARRLQETEDVLKHSGLLPEDRLERMQEAIRGYETHLFVLDEIALKMAANPQKRDQEKKTIHEAERVFDRHAALVASATVTQPVVAAALLAPMENAFDLQSDVFESLVGRQSDDEDREDGREEDRRDFEKRHRARAEEVDKRLRTLRSELKEPLKSR